MDDVSRYEAMRDGGATPLEVCDAAMQATGSAITAVFVLRKVFRFSLAEAHAVMKQVWASLPEPGIRGEFLMFVIDPRTRAPVKVIGMDEPPPEVLQSTSMRPPLADRSGFRSWGRVTRAQLDALVQTDCLPLEDELTVYPPEQAIWSLCYEELNVG